MCNGVEVNERYILSGKLRDFCWRKEQNAGPMWSRASDLRHMKPLTTAGQ